MKGLLVRVGIDQTYGGWNAPVDPRTGDFVYVPIPGIKQRPGFETRYHSFEQELARFPGISLPTKLLGKPMHLDPDFEYLTYGDTGDRRGRSLADLDTGDFIAFYAGLRPTGRWRDHLLYAIIGFYRIHYCTRLTKIPRSRWHENAHTRNVKHRAIDLIVRAVPSGSGRLERCITIGEWRNRAYRVRRELLSRWGGLSCADGYIQRSVVPPSFNDPARFLRWFEKQKPRLIAANNPTETERTPRTLVYKRTHNGDPDREGRFGAYDCMGQVRAREYDAVIGVGGAGAEPKRHGIAERLNWIGIGPNREFGGGRGPIVTFDHFKWFGREGPRLEKVAPALAENIYGRNVRTLMTFTQQETREILSMLEWAREAPPSPAQVGGANDHATPRGRKHRGRCAPACARRKRPATKERCVEWR